MNPTPAKYHSVATVEVNGETLVVEYNYSRGYEGSRWEPPEPPELYVTRCWRNDEWTDLPEDSEDPLVCAIEAKLWEQLADEDNPQH